MQGKCWKESAKSESQLLHVNGNGKFFFVSVIAGHLN